MQEKILVLLKDLNRVLYREAEDSGKTWDLYNTERLKSYILRVALKLLLLMLE